MVTNISGVWSAVNISGITKYQSGSALIDGPVRLTGNYPGMVLIVTSGAVASGVQSPVSNYGSGWSVISVLSGGTLADSSLNTVVTSVGDGGVMRDNTLNHTGDKIYSGGQAINNVKINGGDISASNGATITNLTNTGGAIAFVSSGATINQSTTGSGGTTIVSSGGVAVKPIVASGGSATINSGGTAYDASVLSGGNASLVTDRYPGTAISNVNVSGGARVTISSVPPTSTNSPSSSAVTATPISGVWSAVNISGVTKYQSGSALIDGPVRLTGNYPGMVLIVTSGAVASGVQSPVSNYGSGWSVISVMSGGTLADSYLNTVVTSVGNGGVMRDNTLNYTGDKIYSGGQAVNNVKINGGDISASNGATITNLTNTGGAIAFVSSGATINQSTTGSGGTTVVSSGGVAVKPTIENGGDLRLYGGSLEVCFLAGTMISTPSGERAVEDLQVGDEIITLSALSMTESVQKIRWIGAQKVRANPHLSDDFSGYPITVVANAVADGVPNKDLYITAEHCVYFSGKLSPVRMLVNGRSIYYNKEIVEYTCFHIELDQHSLIKANNMVAESYLDTGNKFRLLHDRSLEDDRIAVRKWEACSVVPLDTSISHVKPIYDAIHARCRAKEGDDIRNYTDPSEGSRCLLLTDTGILLPPYRQKNRFVLFNIPSNTTSVRILSDHGRPCDRIGPFVDDRRTLGLLIGRIHLYFTNGDRELSSHLSEKATIGWNAKEVGAVRWTDGDAYLAIDEIDCVGPVILSLEILDKIRTKKGHVDENSKQLA